MEFIVDDGKFDVRQVEFLIGMIEIVYESLRNRLAPKILPEVLAEVVFNICCAIDGAREIDGADGPVLPVLAFAISQEKSRILGSGRGSWLHEYVYGTVDEYLQDKSR